MRLNDAEEFIEWLLDHIWDEDDWDANRNALDELILRKLSALGYIQVKGDKYVRKGRRKKKTKTVGAEPIRHGHWEKLKDDNDRWRCSHCGWAFIGFNGMHQTFAEMCDYCPCCGAKMDEVERMNTCDKCQYCYQQSNHYKGAEIHTIHHRCHLIDKAVNPYNSCEMWKKRKGKMQIQYKDGTVDDLNEPNS